MSMKDVLRVLALEQQVAELRAQGAAHAEMLISLPARVEGDLMAESPAAAAGAAPAVPCPRCERQRQQVRARVHKHRAAAVDGVTLQDAVAEDVAGEPSLGV